MNQPMMTLNDGRTMPQLGTGIWQIEDAKTPEVVAEALRVGYRLIDGAAAYKNERGMGAHSTVDANGRTFRASAARLARPSTAP